jgi:hypothetical protein
VVFYLRDHGAGNEIKGHRDGYATSCPGDALYALVKSGQLEPQEDEDPTVNPVDVWSYKGKNEKADAYKYLRETKWKLNAVEAKLTSLEKLIQELLKK